MKRDERFAPRPPLVGRGTVAGGAVAAWSAVADTLVGRVLAPPTSDPGRFAVVDGVHTYYQVDGSGPPLVLVHGLGLSHLSWAAATPALAQRFTVYRLDLPGFGYSDKPPGYASARREAAFVARFLSTLGIERATVMGHSMGGAVALWLAAEHATHLDRVVVVNATEIGQAASIFRLVSQPIVGDVLLKATTPLLMRLLLADPYVHKELVTPASAAQCARFMWTPGARQAVIEHARSYDADTAALQTRLAQIGMPVLIIWTASDPYFPVSVAHQLRDAVPSAHLEMINDAGHLPHEEQPTAFTGIVLDWLAAHPNASAAAHLPNWDTTPTTVRPHLRDVAG